MSRYSVSSLAESDLDGIWLHVATEASPQTADRLIDAITDLFPVLAAHPQMGRQREDIEAGVRSFPVQRYVIYYKAAAGAGVLIARVLHASRDQLTAWTESDE